jgi:hypothetical protein
MALFPATRRPAGRLALSMLASFPGVFLAQIVVFPVCLVPLLASAGIFWLLGSDSSVAAHTFVPAALLAIGLFALGSLCGFYLGLSVAWQVSGGESLPVAIRTNPLVEDVGPFVARLARLVGHRWRKGLGKKKMPQDSIDDL